MPDAALPVAVAPCAPEAARRADEQRVEGARGDRGHGLAAALRHERHPARAAVGPGLGLGPGLGRARRPRRGASEAARLHEDHAAALEQEQRVQRAARDGAHPLRQPQPPAP